MSGFELELSVVVAEATSAAEPTTEASEAGVSPETSSSALKTTPFNQENHFNLSDASNQPLTNLEKPRLFPPND